MRAWCIWLVVAVFFAGCGDDEGDTGNRTGDLAGIWLGAFVSETSSQNLMNLNAVVSPEDNQVFFISIMPETNTIHAEGTLTLAGGEITSVLTTSDQNGAPVGRIDLSADLVTLDGETGIQGTYTGDEDSGFFEGTGTVSFAHMTSLYEHPSSISQIAGTWTAVDEESTQVIIAEDGAISGDNGECIFDGQITVYDPNYNLADVQFRITNCGAPWDGSYTGMLYGTANDDITIVISKSDFGFVLYLER